MYECVYYARFKGQTVAVVSIFIVFAAVG